MDDSKSPGPSAAWRTCLDFETQDAQHYFDYVNTGLLGLIEPAPRRVLDIGCAAGAFGAALKQRFPGVEVVGIEAGKGAAEKAAARLDRVVRSRIEDLDLDAAELGGPFDAVIAADVLEHLYNPWKLLQEIRPKLAEGGQLLACIPNVRNLWLVNRLLAGGRWQYEQRGLLDVTHLRFFTRTEMYAMFQDTGYRVEAEFAALLPSLAGFYEEHRRSGASVIELDRLTLKGVTPKELIELCAAQFLFRARPAGGSASA